MNKPNNGEDSNEFDLLKMIYLEISSKVKQLTDIRFKLLGLLPTVSVFAWWELYKNIPSGNIESFIIGLMIAALGSTTTLGIWIYNERNTELYKKFIENSREIEKKMGAETGIFLKNSKPEGKGICSKFINHGAGMNFIYGSVFTGWVLILSWHVYRLIKN